MDSITDLAKKCGEFLVENSNDDLEPSVEEGLGELKEFEDKQEKVIDYLKEEGLLK